MCHNNPILSSSIENGAPQYSSAMFSKKQLGEYSSHVLKYDGSRYFDGHRSTVYKAVILLNFNYCPLIWLFCNKGANKEINRTHKRALRILYEDYESSFETLLARSGSNSIHIKNLQKLMTEIYKSMNHLSPSIVWEFHEKKRITYNLRTQNLCKLPTIKTLGFGLDSLSFRGSFLWNTLDDSIKQVPTLSRFKKRIKDWTADRCTCKICR